MNRWGEERRQGRPDKLRPVQEFEMRQFREAGMSIEQLATYFKVSRPTVHRVLAKQRAMWGAEKLPPRLAGRSRLRAAGTQK